MEYIGLPVKVDAYRILKVGEINGIGDFASRDLTLKGRATGCTWQRLK